MDRERLKKGIDLEGQLKFLEADILSHERYCSEKFTSRRVMLKYYDPENKPRTFVIPSSMMKEVFTFLTDIHKGELERVEQEFESL